MTAEQTAKTLVEVEAHEAQTAALKSRLLRHAESIDLPAATGAASVANMLAHRHRLTRREAHRQRFLAEALETHRHVEAALDEGRVNLEQCHAIVRGLASLPDDLDEALAEKAELHLIELARDYDAKALKGLARSILEVVAPDEADAHLAKLSGEGGAQRRRGHPAHDLGGPPRPGSGQLHARPLTGAMFKKQLFARSAPEHRAASGPLGERKATPKRLGEAFAEMIQRYPTKGLPKAGGLNATVVVLMPLETLMGGLKAAQLDTGEVISASLARQIACEAGIIPAVLGGRSEVLDLGRSKRFHSRAQRIKATIEQGGCIEEGCDAPPAFTHMHHPDPWSEGGETNGDAWMLCPSAHRRVHDAKYVHERLPERQGPLPRQDVRRSASR